MPVNKDIHLLKQSFILSFYRYMRCVCISLIRECGDKNSKVWN